jgi:hypothetical protein
LSVPINDFANEHEGLADEDMETYYPCCGKSICKGCTHSFKSAGNSKCPFCNSDESGKTGEDGVEEIMKRVEANDPGAIYMLAGYYYQGVWGFQQDHAKAIELYVRAADLGYKDAHFQLGMLY